MTVSPSRIIPGVVLLLSNELLYTQPAGTKSIIEQATLTNLTGGAVDVSVWLVPEGGGQTDEYLLRFSAAASVSTKADAMRGHVIEAGGKIYMRTDTGGQIAAMVTAGVVT